MVTGIRILKPVTGALGLAPDSAAAQNLLPSLPSWHQLESVALGLFHRTTWWEIAALVAAVPILVLFLKALAWAVLNVLRLSADGLKKFFNAQRQVMSDALWRAVRALGIMAWSMTMLCFRLARYCFMQLFLEPVVDRLGEQLGKWNERLQERSASRVRLFERYQALPQGQFSSFRAFAREAGPTRTPIDPTLDAEGKTPYELARTTLGLSEQGFTKAEADAAYNAAMRRANMDVETRRARVEELGRARRAVFQRHGWPTA